jgi:alginate O-acetyltransferase complex protein AlgI
MLFASLDYVLFFIPVLIGYWLLSQRTVARLLLLVAASYFFYCASPKPSGSGLPTPWYFIGLLVISTLVDYTMALLIAASARGSFTRRLWLGVSLCLNLGMLAYFKYVNFALSVAEAVAGVFHSPWMAPTLHVTLPIGISFYTFQSLSYTIDVYRGRLTPERNLLRFAAFIAFFPQLVAGPIVRASEFLPQLHRPLRVHRDDVSEAVWRIGRGVFKKVVFADFVAAYFTDIVFSAPGEYTSLENLLALYAFTLQIYGDFSGYSDIAIGSARLLGFQMPENFDRPYQATGVGEFWRRWHMTLSTWLRDYLFFPLGGSRISEARTYLNLWLTMFLVGMWHGASWNFVVYANLQAAAMFWNRFMVTRKGQYQAGAEAFSIALVFGSLGLILAIWPLGTNFTEGAWFGAFVFTTCIVIFLLPRAESGRLWYAAHVLLTFHFTTLSRVFFRADALETAQAMTRKIWHWDGLGIRAGLFRAQSLAEWGQTLGGKLGTLVEACAEHAILAVIVVGLGYHFVPSRFLNPRLRRVFFSWPAPALGVILAAMAWLTTRLLSGPRANIYFSF